MILGKTVGVAALGVCLSAQSMIPTKAGLVSYADEAYIDNRLVEVSPMHPVVMNKNAVLRTGAGRAEVLLGPCAAMWIDEKSSFRMVSTALSDVRIEVVAGSAVVATGAMVEGNRLTLLLKTSTSSLYHQGAYHFDREPPRVKVLAGKTTVHWESQDISLSAGRFLLLGTPVNVRKVDKHHVDPLDDWGHGRAAYLAWLAGQQPENAQQPTLPTMTSHSPTPLANVPKLAAGSAPPSPNSSSSGCGVAAW